MAYGSLAELVQAFENPSGDPTALNYRYDSTHTASGLYQITNSTWGGYGGYSSAANAPSDVQTSRFSQLVSARGLADWTCPGCNTALSNYLSNNPDAASLPVTAAGGTAGASSVTGSTTGGTGTTDQSGCGSLWNPGNWHCAIIGSFAGRFLYGLIGLMLIVMAMVVYALRTRDEG